MKRVLFVAALVAAILGVVYATGVSAPVGPSAIGDFGEHRVKVFFSSDADPADCSVVRGFTRRTAGVDVLHDAMNQVLRGPRAWEERDGAWSFFSHRTAGMINSVRIRSGVAYVDFDDFRHVIPNASSSCGSTSLMRQLNRTAKQFPRVTAVRYSFEGSRTAFYEWLQLSTP